MKKLEALKAQGKIRIIYGYDDEENFLIIPQIQYDKLDDLSEAGEIWDLFGQTIDEQVQEYDTKRRQADESFAGALTSWLQKKEAA